MSTPEERQRARDRAADAISIPQSPGRPSRSALSPTNVRNAVAEMRKDPMPDLVKCEYCPRTVKPGAPMDAHVRASHPHMVGDQSPPPSIPETNGSGIRWEEPPTGSGSRLVERFRPFVVELKRNPGRWARCIDYEGKTSAGGQATALKKAFPDLQIIGRKIGTGSAIFARFVGEG